MYKRQKLESVGSHSFEGCTALEALYLPMIKTIGEKAFENANALTTLSLEMCIRDSHIGGDGWAVGGECERGGVSL